MIKRFIFHYDPNYPDSDETSDEGAISPNEILIAHDGHECYAYIEGHEKEEDIVEIYFYDGNEFVAYMHELEEVKR